MREPDTIQEEINLPEDLIREGQRLSEMDPEDNFLKICLKGDHFRLSRLYEQLQESVQFYGRKTA